MTSERYAASATGPGRSGDPEAVDPFDPVALQERLREAKIRRERVLAARSPGARSPGPADPSTPPDPVGTGSTRGGRAFRIAALLAAGAGVGAAAAMLTSESILQRAPWSLGSSSELAVAEVAARPEVTRAAPLLATPGQPGSGARTASPDLPPPDLPPPWRMAAVSARAPAADPAQVPQVRFPARRGLPPGRELPAPARSGDFAADITPAPLWQPDPSRAAASAPPARAASTVAPPYATASSVYLNVPSTVPDEIARAAVETLREATSAEVFLASVAIPVSRTNVRYYHARDSAAASRIAGLLEPSEDGSLAEPRDFTDYDPKPEPGTIEVWFAGDAPAARPVAAAPANDTPRQATVRIYEPRTAPAGGGGVFGAVGRSLAALLGSSDGPAVSVPTRGASGPAGSGYRDVAAPSAPASSGGSAAPAPSSPSASGTPSGGSPARTSTPASRSQASAPATRGATAVSPSRSSGAADPSSPSRSEPTGSAGQASTGGTGGASTASSPDGSAGGGTAAGSGGGGKSESAGGRSSKSSGGGKSKDSKSGGGRSKESKSSGGGKSKDSKSSGGGKSGSKGGGNGKGGGRSGGKGK